MDAYRFQLFFKGQLVENSADAFDVANTIIATTQSIQEIISIRYGEEASKEIKLNINAFKAGSLYSDFIMFAAHAGVLAAPLFPVASNLVDIGKTAIDGISTFVEVKKLLKGKQPKKIEALENGSKFQITAMSGATIIINQYDFRAIQSKTLARNMAKAVQPLTKDNSLLNEIGIKADGKEIVSVDKDESVYISSGEETQAIEGVKYKGTISKIDTKACSGFLDIGSKRLGFNFPRSLDEKSMHILVTSLEKRIQIYVTGNVTMDYEGNPSSMSVTGIESEVNLFS